MAFHIHAALAALCVAFVASQAHLPGEIYWSSVLPGVTMPRAISDVLVSDAGKADDILPEDREKNYLFYHYGLGLEKVLKAHEKNYLFYHYGLGLEKAHGTDEDEVVVNPPTSRFFLEKDLVPGKQMEMAFTRPESVGYAFVPRQVANSIPFASDKLSMILIQLSIDPESPKAQLMKDTLNHCDFPAGEGEIKTCATSLEAMIDFSVQRLGKNIQAVSTEPEKYAKFQNFTILPDIKRIGDDKAVSCHPMDYAYAVFYCHDVIGAKAYVVPLVGTRGTKVKAVAVCHTNTSTWNPEHLAFKVLNVKPGGEPVCHFFPQHHVLWTAQPHLAMPASDF